MVGTYRLYLCHVLVLYMSEFFFKFSMLSTVNNNNNDCKNWLTSGRILQLLNNSLQEILNCLMIDTSFNLLLRCLNHYICTLKA